jgi:regulator of cell morphogenesis and NO signaling
MFLTAARCSRRISDMSANVERTVRDLAVEVPGATRVFEKLGIDYCCGGGRSIADACFGAGISVEEVMAALEAGKHGYSGKEDGNWHSRPLKELTDHIVRHHHVFTGSELARLDRLSAKVVSVHGQNHPGLSNVRDRFLALQEDLIPHMLKEEQVLFPYIERLEEARLSGCPAPKPFFGTVRNPIQMMIREHDAAGDLLRELRSASGNYEVPADGCISYRSLYQALEELERNLHEHIHLENNILFPRAVTMEKAG